MTLADFEKKLKEGILCEDVYEISEENLNKLLEIAKAAKDLLEDDSLTLGMTKAECRLLNTIEELEKE